MVDKTGTSGGGDDDSEPVGAGDVASYIYEMTRGMAIAAEDAGLDDLADALKRAQRQAAKAMRRSNGH